MTRYLLLDNPSGKDGRFNVGDDIQTIAAARLMPKVDGLVCKEMISKYHGSPGKILLNGWFMHEPNNWPPSASLESLITSIHITEPASKAMLSGAGLAYFMDHGPIGCRDKATLDILAQYGIDAYLSGCLTLTLERSNFIEKDISRHGVFVVDLFYKLHQASNREHRLRRAMNMLTGKTNRLFDMEKKVLDTLIPNKLRRKGVKYLQHSIPISNDSHEVRWERAMEVLKIYANAELVITSRIHCALPCLAFNTPVIFVDAGLHNSTERARVDTQLELLHVVQVDNDGEVMSLPEEIKNTDQLRNKSNYMTYRELLTSSCESFFATS